jgi:predicted nucleic acid-binding protein
MAVDYSKGHYDMTYLRLAEQLGCRWCTADRKVLRAPAPGFPVHRVLLLSSLRRA